MRNVSTTPARSTASAAVRIRLTRLLLDARPGSRPKGRQAARIGLTRQPGGFMIKRIGFVRRHASLDVESFHERWRTRHADLVTASPAGADVLLRYEQHRRTARDYERADCPYDGVAVQWYESWDAFWAMRDDPRHAEVRADAADLFGDVLEVFTG